MFVKAYFCDGGREGGGGGPELLTSLITASQLRVI